MKRIKKLFALLLAATLAASLLAVPAMGAEPAGHGYTYYVMMKLCESGPAEYFVENDALADALAALKIDGAPVFSVEKAADEGVWYITACDGDFTPTEVANALDGIKALAIGSGTLADNTLTLGYDALVLVKTRAGTCLVSEVTSAAQNLFERPAPADKTEVPTVELVITEIDGKTVSGAVKSAEIGSTVTYTITVKIKNGNNNVKLHHTLSDGLTLNTANTTITPHIYNTDKVTWSDPTDGQTAYTMDFPNSVAQSGDIYTITCTATVNESAKIAKGNTLSAHLSYGNNGSSESLYSEVSLYTFGFDLLLKNGAGVAPTGAAFTLSRTKDSSTYYYTLPTDTNNAVEARFQTSETAPTIETDTNGKISFTGLAAGTYTLTETNAATGYDKLSPITINIGTDGKLTVDPSNAGVISNKANVTLDSGFSYNVLTLTQHANTPMPQFPSTGGSGTVAFYLAGGIMMLTAVALFVFRRKNAA